MEILLAVVAVILIVAIVGVLLLKKKQSAKPSTLVRKTPTPHVAPQSSDIEDLLTPEPKTQAAAELAPAPQLMPEADPLAKAELLVNDQRYDEAVIELKKVILKNPKNSAALIKLLQVYGITNNQSAFNALHKQIHAIGDTETIKEADFCRSLLMDEMELANTPSPITSPAPKTPETSIDGEPETPQAHPEVATTQAPAQPEPTEPNFDHEFDLDFDLGNTAATDKPTPTKEATDEFTDFDLAGFDDLATDKSDALNTIDAPQAITDEPSFDELGTDFDLSFDEPSTTPASQPIDELSFDDLGTDSLGDTGINNDKSADEFADFTLDTPTTSTASSTDTLNDLSADFDLSFDELKIESTPTKAQSTPVAEPSFDELGADFDLSFDEPKAEPAPPVEAKTDLTVDDFAFDMLDDTPATQAAEESSFKTEPDKSSADEMLVNDEFELDTPAAKEVSADDFSADFDLDVDIGELTPTVNTDIADSIPPAQDDDFSADFDLDVDFGEPKTTPNEEALSLTKEPATVTPAAELLLDDLVLGEEGTSTSSVAQPSIEAEAVKAPTDDLALDDIDIGGDFGINNTVDTPETPVAPVIPATPIATSEPKSEISFSGIEDSAQVTLNLANQYLSLGEQDSAKRLLAEVLKNGNAHQQSTAQKLLTRLG